MRLVLDTNTALSGLIWGGFPGRLIDAGVSGQVQWISSMPLLSELAGVLGRPKFLQPILKRGFSMSDLFDGYSALVECLLPADREGLDLSAGIRTTTKSSRRASAVVLI